jgi:transcriptional regulator with XRE-family HTH domain
MAIERSLLGKAIRQVRQLRGLSQAALADAAGVGGNFVALVERGEKGVSMETLNALADALRIPAACLAMLGTSNIAGQSDSKSLVSTMQDLMLTTMAAQETTAAQEEAKKATLHRITLKKRSREGLISRNVKVLAARGVIAKTKAKVKLAKKTRRKQSA